MVVWDYSTIHGDFEKMLTVSIVHVGHCCYCLGSTQIKIPTSKVVIQQLHILVSQSLHNVPAHVCDLQGEVISIPILL